MELAPKHDPAALGDPRTVFWVSVAVTVALYLVPYGQYVAYPLLLLSTLVHELGHGVTAVITGGTFHDFKMWVDGSGVASHGSSGGALSTALVAAGGLIGPAIGAAVGLTCARRPGSSRAFLYVLGLGLVAAEILVVRNGFGLLFVGLVAALCLYVAARGGRRLTQGTVMFLSVQLALSVFSRSDYLFSKTAATSSGVMPSDVQQMASALGGPYWLWGAVCALVSVAVLGVAALSLFTGRSRRG